MRSDRTTPIGQRGASLLEVLVTIVILGFGILGMVGLQSRLQVSEMESYQRAQALILLDDMAQRIATNRNAASSYVTTAGSPLGTGNTCTLDPAAARADQDRCEWSNALQGASEQQGTTKVGAFIGGRGCVDSLGNGEYMVTISWQGMGPVSAPPASVTCGQGQYNGGTKCLNDLCRRVVTTVVRIATLS
jgi:type IV pilus assembly protein PilV